MKQKVGLRKSSPLKENPFAFTEAPRGSVSCDSQKSMTWMRFQQKLSSLLPHFSFARNAQIFSQVSRKGGESPGIPSHHAKCQVSCFNSKLRFYLKILFWAVILFDQKAKKTFKLVGTTSLRNLLLKNCPKLHVWFALMFIQ